MLCRYIDDVVIFSKTPEEHKYHLEQVFERLAQAGLKLKMSKCDFAKPEVKLLGYLVNKDGIKTNPAKISAIEKLQPPTNVREIRSFLGISGYYRQCLEGYARVAEPLVKLTRKSEPFVWTEKQAEAFQKLKTMLTTAPVIAHPRLDLPYKLYTDACNYAIGAILCQVHEDGVERVVQYVSHQLSGAQLNWATIEKEAYAVVYAIGKLRPYLYGAEFKVYTDHKPLASLFTKEFVNTKIQRWAVLLAEYGAKIEYRQGKNNIRADMLSRIKPESIDVCVLDWVDPHAYADEDADKNLPILHDGLDLIDVSLDQQVEFVDELCDAEVQGEESGYVVYRNVLYSIHKPTPTSADYPRIMLPTRFRERVITRAHEEVGHMSTQKTLDRVRESYVWPTMRKTIAEQLKLCPVCRVHHRQPVHVPMGEMPLPASPMQLVSMDLIGAFPVSPNGNKYILTIIDHFTGWGEAYPIPDKTNQAVWNVFSNKFIPCHGVPEVVITDNGKEFCAHAFTRYLEQIGIDHRRTTPVHPASNGRSERFNKSFKNTLTKLVNNYAIDWEDRVSDVLMAHRHSVSSVTHYTPFFLLYGRRPRAPLTKLLPVRTVANYFGNRLDNLAEAFQAARVNTEDSRKYNRERLARRANASPLSVGDSVMVKAEERMTFTSRHDPFWEVYRVRGPVTYIRHQQTGKTKVLNREKLTLVDPNIQWDKIRVRPIRNPRQSSVPTVAQPRPQFHERRVPIPDNLNDIRPHRQLRRSQYRPQNAFQQWLNDPHANDDYQEPNYEPFREQQNNRERRHASQTPDQNNGRDRVQNNDGNRTFRTAKRKNPHYDRNRVQQNWRNPPRTHTPPLIHPTNQNHPSPTQHTFAQATQLQPHTQISPTALPITPQHTSPTPFAYQSIPPVVNTQPTAQNHSPSQHTPQTFQSQPIRQQPPRAAKKSWNHSNYKPYHMQTKSRRPPHPSHFHAEPMEVSGVADTNTRHYYNDTPV